MNVRLRVDGKEFELDVDLTASSVRVGNRRIPFASTSVGPSRTQVEVSGEILTVEGWPEGLPIPPGPVTVSGEVVDFQLLGQSRGPGEVIAPTGSPPRNVASAGPGPGASSPGGGDLSILPPMPGKVVEVRVQVGQRVRRGDVLLVLEAMKMRNEVPSPQDGEVVRVVVQPGDNAPARHPMLVLRPTADEPAKP